MCSRLSSLDDLRGMPARFSARRICSRNSTGICWRVAIWWRCSVPLPCTRVSSSSARSPYSLFFESFMVGSDLIPSELVKISDNRVPRLIPSRVDLKKLSGIIQGQLILKCPSIVQIRTCCNSLILEGLCLDRLCAFLLVSPLISTRLAREFRPP